MGRKLYHISGLIFPALIYIFSKETAVYAAGVFFAAIFIFDLVRLINSKFNLWVFDKISFMFKPREFHSFSGSTYFSAGVFLTLLIFNADIAAAGIVYLSLGDMAAVTVGERYGRIPFAGKTIEGSAAFVAVTFIAVSVLNISGIFDVNFSYMAIFSAAVICAAVELVGVKIDDNFILPIIGAAVLRLFS
jgi:dolichol kinase